MGRMLLPPGIGRRHLVRSTFCGPMWTWRKSSIRNNWANYTPADAPDSSVTWSNRSLACQGKQFNLQLLTQGRTVFNASKVTLRAGLNDCTTNLPSGTSGASQSGGWANILTILRRAASNIEKLFAVQTSGVGTNAGQALGGTTNPALMNFEGSVTYQDILNAWNS